MASAPRELKPKYHLSHPDTDVYVGDNRQVLKQLPQGSVDMIFADPPFNWDVNYDKWDDDLPREDYLGFTRQWLDACIGVLAEHGSIWVNIPDDTAAEVVTHLKAQGLAMINWCIWHFRFGQCRNGNFIVSKVHVLYFAKNAENRIWNGNDILEPSDRATTYGDHRTRSTQSPGMRVPLDVWYGQYWGRIQGNNAERRAQHQNQIPEVYLERVIRACSNEGDLVLDPFLGSGTTCTVARSLGRRSIGIEYGAGHARSAFARIKEGPVRIETATERKIRQAFFGTHRGLMVNEVICDDELCGDFLQACKEQSVKLSERECCRTLLQMDKSGKLGPSGKKRKLGTIRQYEQAKQIVRKVAAGRKKAGIEQIMCDPKRRKEFDKKIRAADSEIAVHIVRRAAMGL